MSIIHDALKKVQKSMQDNTSPATPLPSQEDVVEVLPSSSRTATRNPTSLWLLVVIALMMATLLGGYYFLKNQKTNDQLPIKLPINLPLKVAQKPPIPNVQTAIPSVPSSTTPQTTSTPTETPTFTIQGIMSNNNHNVALINNNIYEEGSVINGQKIVKIALDAITLQHADGTEEILPTKK
ncbi:MAG: hypothetical protein HQL15_04065 [Candidatus Omnitrophica bacterium]|nr:hypothetical protein [Candidatus Omnitrophota bacterium]